MFAIPGPASILDSEVHLWRISLDGTPGRLRAVCRALLCTLLARYTGCHPAEIRFVHGPRGKPSLDARFRPDGIEFNVSHSGGTALIALAKGWPVGIDVERISEVPGAELIARRWFSPEEDESILSLPAGARAVAFCRCWTRKEAVVKAIGGSMAELSRAVTVSTDPREAARIVAMPSVAGIAEWHLEDVAAGDGFAAALCYGGARAGIRMWEAS